jgi:hypothetical protein
MLVEIIADNLSQSSFTRSRLTYDNSIYTQADFHDIFPGMEIGIGIDDRLQLFLDIIKTNQLVQYVLRDKWLTTPLTELRYRPVFLMTMLTNHIIPRPFVIV